MDSLRTLLRARGLYAQCPKCDETFNLRDAALFDATRQLPAAAEAHLSAAHASLAAGKRDLAAARRQARDHPERVAEAVRIGKVVEKIAPSLPGFPLRSADCRALFEPIDYVAFKGLTDKSSIDAIVFIDVKSGGARLQPGQRQIKQAIEAGHVSFEIAAAGSGGAG